MEQQDEHQQPSRELSQAPAAENTTLLSPSAAALAEAAQTSNDLSASQPHRSSTRTYHRWPSYALEVSHAARALHLQPQQPSDQYQQQSSSSSAAATTAATTTTADVDANAYTNANNLFLFSDQISIGPEPYNRHDHDQQHHRRMPINILKLPWQHPFRHHESNRNPYKVPRALFATLFLTTTLALLSAWDAQNHCVSNETDALIALLGQSGGDEEYWSNEEQKQDQNGSMDDEEAAELSEMEVLAVKATCREMFRQTMIPVGLVTGAGSFIALAILRFHQQAYGSHRKPKGTQALSIEQSPPCFYSFYLPLLFMSGLITAAWTVGIICLMLRPRTNDTDNPYTSLAAVDEMGRVADNANLYYLSWMSEGLAILIFYQLFGAFVRQHCPPVLPTPSAAAAAAITTPSANANPNTMSTTASASNLPWQRQIPRGAPMLPSHHRNQPNSNSTDNSLVHQYPKTTPGTISTQNPTSFPPSSALTATISALQHHHHEPTTQLYHSSRIKWYQTFYGLRVRTGIWVAALLSSIVVVVSSAHIFHEILLPAAQSLFDDDDYFVQYEHHNNWLNLLIDENNSYRRVCVILSSSTDNLSEELCSRTFFSLLSGFAAIVLCTTAIVLHFLTRRSAAAEALYFEACGGIYHELALQMMATKHHHLPLRTELALSVVLGLWLGWNALLVSSVQGPAPRVGNLYYASWICFLLSLRICLGCVEEFFNIKDDEDNHNHQEKQTATSRSKLPGKEELAGNHRIERPSYVAPDLSRLEEDEAVANNQTQGVEHESAPTKTKELKDGRPTVNGDEKVTQDTTEKAAEKERSKRLRRYFFLGAFSTVCAGSAYDAAKNQSFVLSAPEKYMILAPTITATLSAVLFLLCLSKTSYVLVSHSFWCGGALSFFCFALWVVNLIITMHSNESWAVNGVGEIEMANLYYFSWASIITAGLQMTSYFKETFGLKSEDDMTIIWAAIGKVSFVILGAAGHIWHTISDQCDIVEIQNSAITFCSRTILSMFVSGTGMIVAGLVVFIRVLVPLRLFSARSRAHCEAVLSIFLVLLFGAASGMITGIGGPGQSVGDLYYSTWLSFWLSIGAFVSCYDQIKLEELESAEEKSPAHGTGVSDEALT